MIDNFRSMQTKLKSIFTINGESAAGKMQKRNQLQRNNFLALLNFNEND